MDTNIPAPKDDREAERRCLEAAVEASRRNQTPGRDHREVRAEMLRKIAALDARIAALAAK
jgi:hypothetical protein